MAITVDLYTNNSEDNKINKAIVPITTIANVHVKEPSSMFSPTVVFDYTGQRITANYLKAWDKYYFIRDIILAPGKKVELICEEDPLMTFKTRIEDLYIILDRTGTDAFKDSYLPDTNEKLKQYTESHILNFQNSFDTPGGNGVYVLSK